MLGVSGVLKLEDIHSHWRIKRANESEHVDENLDDLLRINEPAIVRPSGRPPGSRNKRRRQIDHEDSTRRDPSGFKYARALFDQAMINTQEP